jgi:hypothetical protein
VRHDRVRQVCRLEFGQITKARQWVNTWKRAGSALERTGYGSDSGGTKREFVALQWKHVHDDHVQVEQRTYKGHIDTPKTAHGKREVAISPQTHSALDQWKEVCQLGHGLGVNLDVYTVAGLDQLLAAVNTLEESLISLAVN